MLSALLGTDSHLAALKPLISEKAEGKPSPWKTPRCWRIITRKRMRRSTRRAGSRRAAEWAGITNATEGLRHWERVRGLVRTLPQT